MVRTCTTAARSLYDPVIQRTGGPTINTTGRDVAFVEIRNIDVPRRREHISDLGLTDLAHAIKKGYLRHPIVITPEHLLLDGERRMRAAQLVGETKIRALVAHTLEEASRYIAEALADNDLRVDMSYTELCRSMDVLLDWSASERQMLRKESARVAGKVRHGLMPPKGRARLNSRDYIAAALGISSGSLGRLKIPWQATKSADPDEAERALQAMKMIDTTGTVTTYVDMFQAGQKIAAVQPKVQRRDLKVQNGRAALPRVEPIADPREQARLLNNAVVQLNGINIGLAQVIGATGAGLSEEERWQIVDTLSTTRRLTRTLARSLSANTDE